VSEDNLATVRTFGFRGEALPSIILVARLRMLSRERTVLFSTEVRLESGKVGSLREAGAPVGTTVEFFPQAPARRTFLRSLRREYS
jgi:DNA mismatch repair protein MutL